jgi:hypothetical protein
MKFSDWLQSGKFIRNRDVILNIFWLVLTAFIIGLLIGSEYNENGAGASLMKRCVAVEGEVQANANHFKNVLRTREYQTAPDKK